MRSGGVGEAASAWNAQGEDAIGEFGGEGVVGEVATEAQPEFVIELGVFEVGGGEVDPDGVGLAAYDDEVGASDDDLDTGGVHSGEEDGQVDGVAVLPAVVVGAARLADGGGDGTARTTAAGQLRREDRVHDGKGKMGLNELGLVGCRCVNARSLSAP